MATVSPSLLAEILTLREASIARPLGDRLLWLRGAEAREWLQGQVTQDLREGEGPKEFCLCEPTGQLLTFGTVWQTGEGMAIVVPAAGVAPFLDRVERMVIMEEVSVEEDPRHLVAIQGPLAVPPDEYLAFPHDRTGSGGYDVWLPEGLSLESPVMGDEAWNVVTLEAGLPELGVDTHAKTLPPELGPDFDARTTSYQKGCYTGQEVLMRIHSRGHANRVWRALLSPKPLEAGVPVSHPRRVDAGVTTRAGFSPRFGWIAGAMLRTEAAEPGGVVMVETSEGPVEAEVRAMPLFRGE